MTMDDQSGQPHKGSVWKNAVVVAASVTAIGGIVVAAIGILPGLMKSDDSPAPSSSGSPGQADASPSPTGVDTSRPSTSNSRYLFDMNPADQENALTGNRNIAGTDYPHSVAKGINACTGSGRAFVDYPLGGAWKRFDATIGLDQQKSKPGLRVKMTVFVGDSRVGDGYTVTTSTRDKLPTIDVTGAQYIRLESILLGGDNSCTIAGYAVWGDAALSK
jgi:NPCBM/NEW2 domain